MKPGDALNRGLAILLARGALGLMFFMTGVFRVFQLGALEHARRFLVEPYADTFLPVWSLWAVGVLIPFTELIAGALVLIGWRVREALVALGSVLVVVTFGHLLKEPFFRFDTHVIPRLVLLLFILMVPRDADRFSVDHWLARRNSA